MTDCPPVVLSTLSLWPPLAVTVVLGIGVLLFLGWGLYGVITLHREGRRHAAWTRVQEEIFAEQHPDLYAARQARDAEMEARIALRLAQQPPWWARCMRRQG